MHKKLIMVTNEDLFINYEGKFKVRIREHSNHILWNCYNKKRSIEEIQIFLLSMLLYKLYVQEDPLKILLEHFPKITLMQELQKETRTPIIPWEFEAKYPKMASFLKSCWSYEINSLEAMKNRYPFQQF